MTLTKCLFLSVSLLLLSLDSVSGCFSSGLCGGGGGCCGGGGGGGGGMCMPMPPPPPPVCMGGCSRGYSCGSYGCYRVRAKARSSKTLELKAEPTQEELAKLSPDEKFHTCCEERNLPDACMTKCSYRTYTKEALQSMYFKTDACPLQAAADLHFCAAQGADHRACCQRNGVANTLAGEKCMVFCDQRPGNVSQLDMSYLSCFDRFDSMKSCFWYEMTQGELANKPPAVLPASIGAEPSEGDEENVQTEESGDDRIVQTRRDVFQPSARTFRTQQ